MPPGTMATGIRTCAPPCSGPSLTIPFVSKTLTLGTWQQVVYLDFDIRPRHRELVVQMVGE